MPLNKNMLSHRKCRFVLVHTPCLENPLWNTESLVCFWLVGVACDRSPTSNLSRPSPLWSIVCMKPSLISWDQRRACRPRGHTVVLRMGDAVQVPGLPHHSFPNLERLRTDEQTNRNIIWFWLRQHGKIPFQAPVNHHFPYIIWLPGAPAKNGTRISKIPATPGPFIRSYRALYQLSMVWNGSYVYYIYTYTFHENGVIYIYIYIFIYNWLITSYNILWYFGP